MQITCPSCKRKYRLQDSLVKSPYQKMRCSRCGHVFVHGAADDQVEENRIAKPLLSPPGMVESGGEKKSRKGIGILLLAVLIAVILAAAGYYYVNYYRAGNRWLSIQKMEGQETFIRDGKVFLVRGSVINRSTKPRKYVILKAKLFDDKRVSIGEHYALAGLQLSTDEIGQMAKPDLESKIAGFRKSNINTFVLQPWKELPFSVIFADSYTGRPKEFTVEIVEAPRPS